MAQNPTDNKTVSLFDELNVSNERAHEISIEINTLLDNSETFSELLNLIPDKYDRESIIAGVFLGEIILDDDGRLLPAGMTIPTKEMTEEMMRELMGDMIAELLSELESGDITPRDIMGDPKRN